MSKQGEWPPVRGNPEASYQTADGVRRSDRKLVGPLRLGTAPGAGPKGRSGGGAGSSDYGADRVGPKGFDPLGTSDTRSPAQEQSSFISRGRQR